MINVFTVVGRLGKDPELKEGKTTYALFSLAFSVKQKGEFHTVWANCITFGKPAEWICRDAHKGSKIIVSGELDMYQGNDGDNQLAIRVNSFEVLDREEETSKERDVENNDIPF